MARSFAEVSEEEIEEAFFYSSDLVNTKTTIALRVGEERWMYTSTLRIAVYPPLFTSPLGDICIHEISTSTLFTCQLQKQFPLNINFSISAQTENLTIRLENVVRALQNVSHISYSNKEAVLEMARNFQLMFWECHRPSLLCISKSNNMFTRCRFVTKVNQIEWIPGRLEGQNFTSRK